MFDRLIRIIGEENLSKINSKKVLVLGLGGVGGLATETLIRNGITNIIIVDNDKIDITNKNRQIIALDSNVGILKVDAFEKRIKDINNDVNIIKISDFIDENNIDLLFKYEPDYIIDACDSVNTKVSLIKECLNRNIKFISCMGMGKKMDISKLKIMDIKKTNYDKLAKVIRKRLKDDNVVGKVTVLSSDENVINTKEVIGSYSPVTMSAGIYLADYIIKEIIKEND
ncbi:MAG: ThiF family adenylyltransferase [Bacilli bacterium]|nr:ThiF family adenylyltransferase [Bacilli bacterium]